LQKDFNPKSVEDLCRISKILVAENEYLEKETKKIFSEFVSPLGMTLTLSLSAIIQLDLALQRRLIRELYHSLLPHGNLSYQHVESVLSFLRYSQSGKEIVLPGGVKVWFEFDQFFMGWREFENLLTPEMIEVPGEKTVHSGELQLSVIIRRHLIKEPLRFSRNDLSLGQIWDSFSSGRMLECSEYFDGEKIQGPVMIRSRQSGDFYDPIGLGGFKKAKEILIDEKVPLHLRNHVPFFVSNGKIFWIGGYRVSESFKVQPDTQEILEVQLKVIALD
jgi:tRNA(Ile)-lysidine synthase